MMLICYLVTHGMLAATRAQNGSNRLLPAAWMPDRGVQSGNSTLDDRLHFFKKSVDEP